MPPQFAHIDHWIFDLDNCLYPARSDLFALIDERMKLFIERLLGCDSAEARRVQKLYFHDHGTTLSGLMHHQGVDPHDFLSFVHDIPMDRLDPAPRLRKMIDGLPGEKLVFTNGDAPYAQRVLAARGLDGLFSHIHDIHATEYVPKPEVGAYASLLKTTGIDPTRALFAEDMARNLAPAKALGMTTIWVDNGSEWGGKGHHPDMIDHQTTDIEVWLSGLTKREKVA